MAATPHSIGKFNQAQLSKIQPMTLRVHAINWSRKNLYEGSGCDAIATGIASTTEAYSLMPIIGNLLEHWEDEKDPTIKF